MPQRGDAIFWPGHVAIVRDRKTLIHANAHHMAVAIEPIDRGDRAHQGDGFGSDGGAAGISERASAVRAD